MSITFDVTTRRGRERVREVFTGRKVISLSPDDLVRARTAGYEPDGDHLIGRDPRETAREELEAMGHEPVSPVQAIRLKCLDCCAGSADEVRNCVAMACPSWPFRMGKNPWREVSDARRDTGRRLAALRAGRSSEPRSNLAQNDGTLQDGPNYPSEAARLGPRASCFRGVPGTDLPIFRLGIRQTRRPSRLSGRGSNHHQAPPSVAALAHVFGRDRALYPGRLDARKRKGCSKVCYGGCSRAS